jgi:Protein of unknown function (DUF1302)
MSASVVQRVGLLGSCAALALLSATAAQAVETKFGEVNIILDTTVSMGGSIRTADRETNFLPEGNGGPVDPRDSVALGAVFPATPFGVLDNSGALPLQASGGASFGAFTVTGNPDNYDGSSNADDARLNYDRGDLIGGNVKATHDLQMTWQNYKVFVRAIGFYDAVLNDKDVGERSEITDKARGDVGRNYKLLDAFVSADYTIADMPANLRVGKQVINWGESTFILHGNNAFNPIDVTAFRRPGSEIKEALLPVNAVFGSISLPFDVSLAGYYALDWEPYRLDPAGTPFSTSDVVNFGSGAGGNIFARSQLSGSPYSGTRRNCNADNIIGVGGDQSTLAVSNGLLRDPLLADAAHLDCTDSPFVDYTVPYTIGMNESVKNGLIGLPGITRTTQGLLSRNDDHFANNTGDFGLSAKWYAESLGGTEFGFYYQNYASRLPFASEDINSTGEIGISVTSNSTQLSALSNRGLLPAGCGFDATTTTPTIAGDQAQASAATLAFLTGGASVTTVVGDPDDVLNATNKANALAAAPGSTLSFTGADTVEDAFKMNCMLAYFQMTGTAGIGNAHLLVNGAETIGMNSDLGLRLDYPEDIRMWGTSFNTTLWGWGVQGDFTFREDAPFQADTDALTIAEALNSCAFAIGVGVVEAAFVPLATKDGSGATPGCGAGDVGGNGVIRNQMYTAQVGTTATFTASEWWVGALGGDLAVVVTEVGMVYVPNVEDTWLDKNTDKTITQYQNIGCQGSDLGLGGILLLDHKASAQCRPNDLSAGLVLLGRMDYNNAFNSGWVVTPQIVYGYDFEGTTPAPYGNYLEDRQSVGLSVTGTLNNNLRLGASYSNFFGGHIANKAKDTDFASLTASYTF